MPHAFPIRRAIRLAVPAILVAQVSFAQQAGPSASEVTEVVVTGSRVSEARAAIGTDHATATVAITSDALLSAPSGITGLKMLESLPASTYRRTTRSACMSSATPFRYAPSTSSRSAFCSTTSRWVAAISSAKPISRIPSASAGTPS